MASDDGDGHNAKKAPANKQSRDRDAILARRKFFIASALAGIAATSCDKEPKVCLNIAEVPREDAGAPMPCLEPLPPPDPTTAPTTSDSLQDPSVCLKIALPPPDAGATTERPKPAPKPRVCLKVAMPKDDD